MSRARNNLIVTVGPFKAHFLLGKTDVLKNTKKSLTDMAW